jgi:hypothetical protein
MAKLKCWEAIYESELMLRYKNMKNKNILEIYPEKIRNTKRYFVGVSDDKSIRDKEFKTKPQAIKFANSYMEKHDKCKI